jgi:hypothetical protein
MKDLATHFCVRARVGMHLFCPSLVCVCVCVCVCVLRVLACEDARVRGLPLRFVCMRVSACEVLYVEKGLTCLDLSSSKTRRRFSDSSASQRALEADSWPVTRLWSACERVTNYT